MQTNLARNVAILMTLGVFVAIPGASAQGVSLDLSATANVAADLPDAQAIAADAQAKAMDAKATAEALAGEIEAKAQSTVDDAKGEVQAHAEASVSAGAQRVCDASASSAAACGSNVFQQAFGQMQAALSGLADAIGSLFASAEVEARVE
jgi:hypothetical protein